MTPEREIRFNSQPLELRSEEGEAAPIRIRGYAAVFNQEAEIAGFFREVIAPGAFDSALARGDDVSFLINHDGLPLARTSSKTLSLTVDETGLLVESELDPGDPDVRRIVPKMRRGDLTKMSFAFTVSRETWDETGDMALRTVHDIRRLYDVSIVTDPAFAGTSIALRSRAAARSEAMDLPRARRAAAARSRAAR